MSVLSIFEATPNRVRSLTRLAACLAPTNRETMRAHMMPDVENAAQFNNLMRETIRLGLLEEQKGAISLGAGVTAATVASDEWFLNHVSQVLLNQSTTSDENRAFPYALAWLLLQPSGSAVSWNSDQHIVMLDQMDGSDCYDVTNEGRFAMLCYWARFLGFAERLSSQEGNSVIPDPTEAIDRRLDGVFTDNPRLAIPRFLERIARDCPVLEDGAFRREVEGRFKVKRLANELSAATSLALWRLEKRRRIKLDQVSDADTWLMSTSIMVTSAGNARRISHIEKAA
jgi:hypothetical protein